MNIKIKKNGEIIGTINKILQNKHKAKLYLSIITSLAKLRYGLEVLVLNKRQNKWKQYRLGF